MVKRSRFVRPIMAGGFVRGYRDMQEPSIVWPVPGNPTDANPHDEEFHVLHLHDGSLLVIGTSQRNGGITSARHVAPGQFDVHAVRHHDNGQCFLGNFRARVDGVEQNPTEDGGSAGTTIFYPSVGDPIVVQRLWDGSLLVRRKRIAVMDFDPDNLEDRWGRRPVPADLPADTQLLWTGCSMGSEHIIRTDGSCHTYTFTFVDHDGSPPNVEKAWLSCGMLLADVFHGGADLLDLASSSTRREIRGEEWRGAEIVDPNGTRRYRRGWNGFRSRVGLLNPGMAEVAQPPVWVSGHAATILHTGKDGAPDGKFALGIYARLTQTSSADAIGLPERMETKVMRNPQFVSDATAGSKDMAMRNSGYGVVVGSQGNGSYPPGYSASISFDWITGAPAQVEAALRQSYAATQRLSQANGEASRN